MKFCQSTCHMALTAALMGLLSLPSVSAYADDPSEDWLAAGPQDQAQGGPMGGGGFNNRRGGFGGPQQGGGFQGGPQGGGQMRGRQGGGPGQILSQLNLSDDQRQKLQTMMQQHRSESQQGRQTMMQKREQLRTMMQSGNGSKEQAKALLAEINKLQSAQMAQRIDMMYDMKSILTPEQFQQFQKSMAQKRGQMRGQMGGQGGSGRQGGFGGRGMNRRQGGMGGGFGGPQQGSGGNSPDGF